MIYSTVYSKRDICKGETMLFSPLRVAAGLFLAAAAASSLSAAPVCDTDNGGITLPQGFCALVVADGLGAARHLTVASNGDVYVALQSQGGRGEAARGGGVVALHDADG